jgi:hypothetical protein
MFTRLSLNFGNLELPNQSRHGCGGAGLARTVIDGVYFRRRILASNSEEKGQEEKRKGVEKTSVKEQRRSQRIESGCQGGSPLSRMRREERPERGFKTYHELMTT